MCRFGSRVGQTREELAGVAAKRWRSCGARATCYRGASDRRVRSTGWARSARGAGVSDRVQQLQEETAAARDAVLALVDGLSADRFDRPSPNEGWSVKDTVAHLASIEARVRLMVQTVLDGGTWTGDRADLDAYNARCVAERRDWTPDAVVAELRRDRAADGGR